MRSLLIVVLLAGAAGPALAAAQEDLSADPRAERPNRAERPQRRAPVMERQKDVTDRLERAPTVQRQQVRTDGPDVEEAAPERRQMRSRRVEPAAETPRAGPVTPTVVQAPGEARADRAPRRQRGVAPIEIEAPDRTEGEAPRNARTAPESIRVVDTVREWRADERRRVDAPSSIEERNLRRAPAGQSGGDLVEQTRPLPPVLERGRRISRTPVRGAEPPPPATARAVDAQPARHWSGDWRRDRRYDWRDWRRRHRSLFRLGFYYDPFGWSYFRYGTGWRLWPSHYGRRYWLHDPWMYRLPPAYGPYRWIRYWDDALLVNIYTGQVVDVIHNFFW